MQVVLLANLVPGRELVFHALDLDGVGGLLEVGVGIDLLEGGDLGGDLLERWEFLLLHTDVQGVGGDDEQGLESLVGSGLASNVHEHGVALVQWVGVVQLLTKQCRKFNSHWINGLR